MDESRRELGGFARLTELARSAASAPVSEEVDVAGRRAVVAAVTNRARTDRTSRLRPLALAAIVALAAAAGLVVFLQRSPLRYEIHGGSGFASNYLSATSGAPASVSFSDGSSIHAAPSTRLRVDQTRANGARVLLERGVADVHVVHRKGSAWLFVAGPFEVKVTGTRFRLAWDPSSEEITITMREGSVEVDSPVGGSHFAVNAGQRFHASLLDGSTKIDRAAEPHAAASAPATAPTQATPSTPPAAPAAREPSAVAHSTTPAPAAPVPTPTRESWSALVRRGAFTEVVADAKARGVEQCLASCGAGDLRALGDAARYTGQTALAQQSLLALRNRFPKSSNGIAAGFLLGRVSESIGQLTAADHWYAGYLAEVPNGEFAADALAGRMRAVAALSGKGAAKPLAAEYLRRYPDGVHARAARAIEGSD